MEHKQSITDTMSAAAKKGGGVGGGTKMTGHWTMVARDKDGNLKWTEEWDNLVTNVGLDHALDVALSGGTQDTTWFVGLTDGTPTTAAADTMASHAGWVEVVAYTEGTREAWVDGGVSAQSLDNSASVAQFSINANSTTVGGAFLVQDSDKSGSTGILYAVGAFTAADKSLDSGDTLDVTATFTAAAA